MKCKRIIVLISFMLISILMVACGNQQGKTKDKTLIIGLDDTFVPMGFKDDNGEISGFDVDVAKAAAEKMGYKIKFQPIDWSMKEMELDGKNIDLIWNGYSITDERKEKVNFTEPYLKNRQVIITLKDSDIKNKSDLNGKSVSAQGSSSAEEAIEKANVVKTFKNGKLNLFDSNNDAFMDLEAKRTDAIVADEIMARYYIQQNGEDKFKVLNEDFGKEVYGVGLRKDDEKLKEELNKTLDELRKDGTMKKISEKWFKEDITKLD